MAYTTAGGGGYGTGASVIHGDSSHSDYISVPDAELLFRGDFHRAGPDLILTGQDGRHHIIPDYFSSETHPALMAPNGATLPPDLVDLLAGSPTPGQYAQAQATTPADAIGKVEKVVGNVTVMRNGVSVALHVGDAVFKSDVIQTGANSSCGVGFPDGTVLDLVANTRMALNEYTFDPDGHSNSALFSLVEGTFAFVAGKVAHTGDMKIATPVATMGIRGTVGLVKKEISTFSANLGEVIYSILLHEDMDGSHHLGRIAVIDRDPTSPTFGEVIFIIADSSYVTYVMPQGPGLPPIVTTEPITDSRLFDDQHIFDDLGQILNYLLNGTNPQSNPSPGSGDNPNGLLPQYFQENNGTPFNINLPFNGPFGPGFGPITIITFNTPPNPGATNTPLPPPPAGSDVFIWPIGDNFWDTPGSWNPNSVPVGPGDTVEILAGTVTYPATDFYTIKFLYLAPGATLDIIGIGGIGGSLTVLNGVDDYGTIIVGGDPPTLAISGPVTVESGGKIEAHDGTVSFAGGTVTVDPASTNEPAGRIVSRGHGSTVEFTNDILNNFGIVAAEHHGSISFSHTSITNDGVIKATHRGDITLANSSLTNESGGIVEAKHHGTINIDNTDVFNDAGAIIAAIGRGSRVELLDGNVKDNSGTILAANFGTVFLSSTPVTNETGGLFLAEDGGRIVFDSSDVTNDGKILSVGCDSLIVLKNNELDNSSIVAARDGGTIKFHGEQVINEIGAKIVADDGTMVFAGSGVTNDGKIEADHGGEIVFASINGNPIAVTNSITNAITNVTTGGTIKATDYGTIAFFGHGGGAVDNDYGLMEATNHGTLIFDDIAVNNSDGGMIEATHAGTVIIEGNGGPAVTDGGGTIAAIGRGSIVDIVDGAVIYGAINEPDGSFTYNVTATLEAADGGTLFVSRDSTLNGPIAVNISGGGLADFADVLNQNATVTVAFSGPGTLELDRTLSTGGAAVTVSGFGIGDTIDLTNFKFSKDEQLQYDQTTGVLTVTDGGKSDSFTVGTNYSLSDFTLLMDPSGGTEIVYGLQDRWTDPCDGCWTACGNWCDGVPTACSTAIIDLPVTVRLYTCAVVGNLVIGACATLDIGDCGSLTVLNALDDGGRILVESTGKDPTLRVDGPVTVERSGEIEARGWLSKVEFFHDRVGNFGVIAASHGGTVLFDGSTVWNERGGKIEATHDGTVIFKDATVTNEFGAKIEAKHRGTVTFNLGTVDNESCGTIVADGRGSTIRFVSDQVDNWGSIAAAWGGAVLFAGATVDNSRGGTIEADGRGSAVTFDGSLVDNSGRIEAEHRGTVVFDDSQVDNDRHGTIKADGWGSAVKFDGGLVDNSGRIEAEHHGKISFYAAQVDNEHRGTIKADGWGSAITFAGDLVDNSGRIEAEHHGTVSFDGSAIANDGWIEAKYGGTVFIDQTTIDNACGVIAAIGCDSTVVLDRSIIVGGTLETKFGGSIEVVDGTSVLDGSQVDCNGCVIAVTVDGCVTVDHGATLDLLGTIRDYGTLDVAGGTLLVSCSTVIDGCGVVVISCGGFADFANSLTQNVTFAGDGTLALGQTPSAGAVVSGFGTGDTIDLTNLAYSATEIVGYSGGILTITDGATVENITLTASGDFVLISDPWGGTEVVYGAEDDWNGGTGTWNSGSGSDWSLGTVAGESNTAEILATAGSIIVTLDDAETVGNLVVGAGATLDITDDGSLTDLNALDVSGTVEVLDSGSTLQIYGPVRVDSGATIEATESGAVVTFYDDQVGNAGTISARDHGTASFDGSVVWNENGGTIEASQHGKISFDDATGTNESGATIEAKDHGRVTFYRGAVDNEHRGTIEAIGRGSTVKFFSDDVDNWGSIAAAWGGAVLFAYATVDNAHGATIDADGHGSEVKFDHASVDNSGRIEAGWHGKVSFDRSQVDNEYRGTIAADGWGSEVKFDHASVDNSGRIEAEHHGTVTFDHSTVDNDLSIIAYGGGTVTFDHSHVDNDGKIEADGGSSKVSFDYSHVDNYGTIGADVVDEFSGGTVTFDHSRVDNERSGTIEARYGDTVTFDHSRVDNDGMIAAYDDGAPSGSTITFDHSSVENDFCGIIQAGGSTVAFDDSYVGNAGTIGELYGDLVGGTVTFDHSRVDNDGGTIEAYGVGSFVDLSNTTIYGGTLDTDDVATGTGGVFEIVTPADGFNTSFFDGSVNTVTVDAYVLVQGGANLELIGTIDNQGTIDVDVQGSSSANLVIDGTVTLEGSGAVTLDSTTDPSDSIIGASGGGTLYNDNTISGTGQIGNGGETSLTLFNDSCGTIDANVSGETLTIHTGDAMTNTGTLEASNGGTLQVDDPVTGGGTVLSEGGTIDFAKSADISQIKFNNTGTPTYGEVILGDPTSQSITVYDFKGGAPEVGDSDAITLAGDWTTTSPLTASGATIVVDLTDGPNTVALTFEDFSGTLNVDFNGTDTVITDPPNSSNTSVSLGNDHFVFHPNNGGDNGNSQPQGDAHNFGRFTPAQIREWLGGHDEGGHAFTDFAHHDDGAGTSAHWHALVQNAVHLH